MQFLSAAISITLSLLIVPLVRSLSFKLGKVKQPRPDRWHRQPTPTLGGIAIFVTFGLSILGVIILNQAFPRDYLALLIGAGLAFTVGLIDDLHPLSPSLKLVGQLLAATVIIFFGNHIIQFFPWPFANILLTYTWIIGVTNSINLLDNMDGLAAGVTLIAAGLLGIILWRENNFNLLYIDLALAGALLGFLLFNFPPAKIFMGDSGSLFIGFMVATLAVIRKSQASSVLAVMGVPILIFLLPILDTTLVTVTRLLRGQLPTQGGTDHTSHRLVSFGLSERQAVLVLYVISLISGGSAIALESFDYDTSLVLIPILLISLSLITAYLGHLKIVTTAQGESKSLSRWMSDLAYRRNLFELFLDLVLVATSYYLAYWTRYGFDMTSTSMNYFLKSWPLALGSAYLMFYLVGVYRGVWRYHGVDDLVRFVGAACGTAVMAYLLVLIIYPSLGYSPDVFLLFAVFLTLGLGGSRLTFIIMDRIYNQQRIILSENRVLLVGAGDEGEMALRWIQRKPGIGFRPIGFIDNDQNLWGRSINSIDILGGSEKALWLIEEKKIDGLIFTSNHFINQPEMQKLIQLCQEHSIWVRILKIEFELLEGN